MVLQDRSILIGQKLVENAKSATFWLIFKHCEYLHSTDVVAKMEWQKKDDDVAQLICHAFLLP